MEVNPLVHRTEKGREGSGDEGGLHTQRAELLVSGPWREGVSLRQETETEGESLLGQT